MTSTHLNTTSIMRTREDGGEKNHTHTHTPQEKCVEVGSSNITELENKHWLWRNEGGAGIKNLSISTPIPAVQKVVLCVCVWEVCSVVYLSSIQQSDTHGDADGWVIP